MKEKVAVKSGYYFNIFEKSEIPLTLKKSEKKVNLNNEIYDLYVGTSIKDERKIDQLFGDEMGYLIEAHEEIQKEKPKCEVIIGSDNKITLMQKTFDILNNNDMPKLANEMCNRVMDGDKNFGDTLCIISDYVEIIYEEEIEDEEFE